jgi:hypothetical protein
VFLLKITANKNTISNKYFVLIGKCFSTSTIFVL